MGMGSWGGNPAGTVPPHPSAWCKVQQGWVNLIEDSANGNVSINEPEAVLQKLKGASMNPKLSTVRKLWSNGDTSGTEYFLVENRLKIGYDVSLPGEGLLGMCCVLKSWISELMMIKSGILTILWTTITPHS